MALYALENLDDALETTRNFLTPVDRWTWAKLALVVLFVGGLGTNPFSFSSGFNGGSTPPPEGGVEIGPEILVIVLAIFAAAILLGLLLALVGSIMEFVLIESLRREEVAVRRYWSRRWKQGLRLFGFRILLSVVSLGAFALLAAPIVLPLLGVMPAGGLSIGLFVLLLPLFVLLAVISGLINGFTTVFVVPIMVLDDSGVLAGWRRLWPTIKREWKQYLAYAVANFVLGMVGGILVAFTTGIGALVLLVPFGVLFAIGFALWAFTIPPVGIAVLVVVGVLYILAIIAVAALIQVPVKTYLRYYALLILGDVEADLDVIPDQRARVRDEPADDGEPA